MARKATLKSSSFHGQPWFYVWYCQTKIQGRYFELRYQLCPHSNCWVPWRTTTAMKFFGWKDLPPTSPLWVHHSVQKLVQLVVILVDWSVCTNSIRLKWWNLLNQKNHMMNWEKNGCQCWKYLQKKLNLPYRVVALNGRHRLLGCQTYDWKYGFQRKTPTVKSRCSIQKISSSPCANPLPMKQMAR